MEDYVTFEQAMKLKELGFDWECNHFYESDNKVLMPLEEIISGMEGHDFRISSDTLMDNFNKQQDICSAPTLSQAQKWLYEKYGLWVEVIYEVKRKSFEYNISNKVNNVKKSFFNPWVKIIYDTPTKALSRGIDKALELLK